MRHDALNNNLCPLANTLKINISKATCGLYIFLSLCFFAITPPNAHSQTSTNLANLLFEAMPMPDSLIESNESYFSGNLLVGDTDNTPPSEDPAQLQESLEKIDEYMALINLLESQDGPFSDQIAENLLAVALLQQGLGDHEAALNSLERSQILIRLNSGLSELSQIPLLEAMTVSYTALQDIQRADDSQETILALHEAANGANSLDNIGPLNNLGQWNVRAFLNRSNISLNLPKMSAHSFVNYADNYMDVRIDRRDSPLLKLYQAQQYFQSAINIAIRNEAFSHSELLNLENSLLTTFFLHIHRQNILHDPDFYLSNSKATTGSRLDQSRIEIRNSPDYKKGQDSFKRSMAYLSNDPNRTAAQVANTLLQEADWHLLFERKVVASRSYQAAFEFFEDNTDSDNAAISAITYPQIPVILPAFLPAPNSREKLGIATDAQVNYIGYFDVSFAIDKYGKARNIEILERTGELTDNIELRLNQYLKNVLFRPRFRDGKVDSSEIALRYKVGI